MSAADESFKYDYRIGDFVWAKMKGFPPWPGKIMEPPADMKVTDKAKKGKQLVFFMGSENYAWIAEEVVWPYEEFRDKYQSPQKKPPKDFSEGVKQVEEQLKLNPATAVPRRARTPSPPRSTTSSVDRKTSSKKKTPAPSTPTKTPPQSTPLAAAGSKKRPATEEKAKSTKPGKSTPTTGKTRLLERDSFGAKKPKTENRLLEFGADFGSPTVSTSHTALSEASASFMPDILPLGLPEQTTKKNIMPTPLKIGFLGIGIMGSGMVENLLKSGHEVTIWNLNSAKCRELVNEGALKGNGPAEVIQSVRQQKRSNRNSAKCRELVNEGALKGSDPAEVIQSCDIIFSCVSDGPALKDLVFSNTGVLQSITAGKAFVDLSTVDVESIQDVSEAVMTRGGRFLEAPVIGTKELAKNGQLLVLASGDKTLYDDCFSCFQAIGRHSMFLGEIASATRMKLVISLLLGTTLAGLAESLALADKLGLGTEDVLRVISFTSASSQFLLHKGGDMIFNRLDEPSCKLQIMAKDLRLSVNMSDTVDQPLHVGAAVCELFKKAKAKGYGEHDVAAVFRAADL